MAIGAPLVGTVATNTAGAATLNVPYPASLTSSHIMVLAVSVNNATRATLPGGWTSVASLAATGNTQSPGLIVGIKQATGSESGNLAVTTPSVKSAGQIIAFSGVNLTTPQDVAATTLDKAAGSANMPLPTLTTTRSGCAVVYVGTMSTGADLATAPGGYTETGDGIGTGGWPITTGYALPAAGATGTVTVVWDNTDKGVGCLLALRNADQQGFGSLFAAVNTLAGDGSRGLYGDGTLTATDTLAAVGNAAYLADGTLAVTDAFPFSSGARAAYGDGTLAVTDALTGDGSRGLFGTGTLAVTDALAGDGSRGLFGFGSLFAAVNTFTGAAAVNRNADGDLTVTTAYPFASAKAAHFAIGDLTVTATLAGTAARSVTGSGALVVTTHSTGVGLGMGRDKLIRPRGGTTDEWEAAGVYSDVGNTERDIRDREIIYNRDRRTLSIGTEATQATMGDHEVDLPYTGMHGPGTVATKVANYALGIADWVVVGAGTSITVTLPDAALFPGRHYTIKNRDVTSLTVDTSGGNIDGSATTSLVQWGRVEVVSDGTDWLTI